MPFSELFQADEVILPLALPDGEVVDFALERSRVIPEALSESFPGFVAYSGSSVRADLGMYADVDYSPVKGLRASIRQPGVGNFWIDPVHRAEHIYQAYVSQHSSRSTSRASKLARGEPSAGGKSAWSCAGSGSHSEGVPQLFANASMRDMEETRGARASRSVEVAHLYTFTIAFVANGEYSQYHGNTVQSVLAEIVTLTNRINGILKRELGVTFQLHEKSADLICLHPCSHLRNTDWILDDLDSFIGPKAHVSRSTYDLAHALTTASGGLACLDVLCDDFYSSCGTTGLPNPITDAFYVDYVLHEIAHQLGADHTFTDCVGANGHRNPGTAVEPGSGSTVLGYAGICGPSNLQMHSDAYFHAVTLEQVRDTLANRAGPGSGCGSVTETVVEAPKVLVDESCVVPASMPFQLALRSPEHLISDSVEARFLYSIEAVDPARKVRRYTSRATPRFRSWEPSTKKFRAFPNMYYLAFGVEGLDEILPSQSANMTFRATVRRETSEPVDAETSAGLGIFSSLDIEVQFRGDILPLQNLRLSSHDDEASIDVEAGQRTRLEWTPGDTGVLDPTLEILVAKNTMTYVGADFESYATDVHDLTWISLGAFPNNGSATFVVPGLDAFGGSRELDAIFMLRSVPASAQACFYFEVISGVKVHSSTPTPTPNPVPDAENDAHARGDGDKLGAGSESTDFKVSGASAVTVSALFWWASLASLLSTTWSSSDSK